MALAIRAIETFYDGHRFRSRLEARWAVFFHELKVPYEYEPEGYKLPSGKYYLPDFWLPRQDIWFEVKPDEPTSEQESLVKGVGEITGKKSLIMFGQIPNPIRSDNILGLRTSPHEQYENETLSCNGPAWMVYPYWDNHYEWCQCPKCDRVGIAYEARSARLGCNCSDSDKEYNPWSEDLIVAYGIARASRFEHSEGSSRYRGGVTL